MAPSCGMSKDQMICAALKVYWEEFNKSSCPCKDPMKSSKCGGIDPDKFWKELNNNDDICQPPPQHKSRCSLNASCPPPSRPQTDGALIVTCAGNAQAGVCAYASKQSLSKCQQPSCQQKSQLTPCQLRDSCQQTREEPPLEEVFKGTSCNIGVKASCHLQQSTPCNKGKATGCQVTPEEYSPCCGMNSVGIGAAPTRCVANASCGQSTCVSRQTSAVHTTCNQSTTCAAGNKQQPSVVHACCGQSKQPSVAHTCCGQSVAASKNVSVAHTCCGQSTAASKQASVAHACCGQSTVASKNVSVAHTCCGQSNAASKQASVAHSCCNASKQPSVVGPCGKPSCASKMASELFADPCESNKCPPPNPCCPPPKPCCPPPPPNPCCPAPKPCCPAPKPCCPPPDPCCPPPKPCCPAPETCCPPPDPCCKKPKKCCPPKYANFGEWQANPCDKPPHLECAKCEWE